MFKKLFGLQNIPFNFTFASNILVVKALAESFKAESECPYSTHHCN